MKICLLVSILDIEKRKEILKILDEICKQPEIEVIRDNNDKTIDSITLKCSAEDIGFKYYKDPVLWMNYNMSLTKIVNKYYEEHGADVIIDIKLSEVDNALIYNKFNIEQYDFKDLKIIKGDNTIHENLLELLTLESSLKNNVQTVIEAFLK